MARSGSRCVAMVCAIVEGIYILLVQYLGYCTVPRLLGSTSDLFNNQDNVLIPGYYTC